MLQVSGIGLRSFAAKLTYFGFDVGSEQFFVWYIVRLVGERCGQHVDKQCLIIYEEIKPPMHIKG